MNGKRIFLMREVSGDHQAGFDAMRRLLEAGAPVYKYAFEFAPNGLNQAEMDALYDRLHQPNAPRRDNTIDILIFDQGQGDCNVAGNPPFPNAAARMAKVNDHVKNGGGLIQVHAAGGREVSWFNWVFGAALMADWFVDDYAVSPSVSSLPGHFVSTTQATYTLDDETLASKDPSTYFIRKILTLPKAQGGYGQPLVTDQVHGEWYNFNGGYRYEDGSGGAVGNPNDKVRPKPVRGDPGMPDSGIGPARVVGVLTKIGTGGSAYTPPGGRRHSVWVRDVSAGRFDPGAVAANGRYALFNPGHGDDFREANGWMGDFFMSVLRWVAKDDLGCTLPSASNYNPLATINADCRPIVDGLKSPLVDGQGKSFGSVEPLPRGIRIAVEAPGSHAVSITSMDGRRLFERTGEGARSYLAEGLENGLYVSRVTLGAKSFNKIVSVR